MNTLEHWEKRLKPYFDQKLGFIGEIPVSIGDLDDLAQEVKVCIERDGLGRATDILTQKFPLSLLTFMASFSAYNTQQNYWQAFADTIGVGKQYLYNYKWHRNFVRLARNYGLKVFDFEDDPNPYVTSIRFQGGIPTYSLPDYFEKIVLPAVDRQTLREANDRQALDHMITHCYFVDSPVLDFLRNSGDLGLGFFSESRKLMKHALTNYGAILTTDEVDLPEYVVDGFTSWWDHREDARQHWSKPYLQVAPYSDDTAVFLKLPQQEITLDLSASRLFWRIYFPQENISEDRPCRVSRSRQSVVTKEDYLTITHPLQRIEVSLNVIQAETGEELEQRRWNLPFIPPAGRTPLVAFNTNGNQIISTRQLPAEALYLLTPLESEMVFDGQVKQIEELIPLVGVWKDWKVSHLDLSQVWSLMVAQAGQPVGDVISIQGILAQPELVGGHLFQFQMMDEPLYTSDLPDLRIPLEAGNSLQSRLSNWQVHISSLWEAAPQIDKNIRLSDLSDKVEIKEDRGFLPLKHILGDAAAGTYNIHVLGPRGLSGSFCIRVWPKLLVIGHSMQLCTPEQHPKPSIFSLHMQQGASCEVQPGYEDVDLKQTASVCRVEVPPEYTRVQLDLIAPSDSGGKVRIPVSIPLPKLQWALATEKDQVLWGQSTLRRSLGQMEQTGSASIHLEMYGLGDLSYSARLRLVEIGEDEVTLQEAKLSHTDFTKDWMRVTLGQFSDSLRGINSLARFDLVYIPPGTDSEPVCYPLLEISRALDITGVALVPVSETSWKLTWQEDHPLKNRRVLIQSAWQPWQIPWEYKVPNKAHGEFILKEVALPPTRINIFFCILPDYVPELVEPPGGILPHTIDLCSPQERLDMLPTEFPSPNEKFKTLVEIAVIYDCLGDEQQRDNYLSQAASSLIHLTNLNLLVGILTWMRPKNIYQPIKSFFFNKMFNIQIVDSMLRNYKPHNPAMLEYLAYADQVKNIPADSAKILLDRIDDPITLSSCLNQLFIKKDGDLPAIMVKMMGEARLSKRDAVDLLLHDSIWAIEKVTQLDQNTFTDSLIAGLLPKVAQEKDFNDYKQVPRWILRALPYEQNEELVQEYIHHCFNVNCPERFDVLMKASFERKIDEVEVMDLLSRDPQASLQALQTEPVQSGYELWISRLIEKFPSAAGLLSPGTKINTPFGIAVVNTIQKWDGEQVDQISAGEPDYILKASMDTDKETLKLVIDYHDMTIHIIEKDKIWKCGFCDYMHPRQDFVTKHSSQVHHQTALSRISLPISFEEQDITINIEKIETMRL